MQRIRHIVSWLFACWEVEVSRNFDVCLKKDIKQWGNVTTLYCNLYTERYWEMTFLVVLAVPSTCSTELILRLKILVFQAYQTTA